MNIRFSPRVDGIVGKLSALFGHDSKESTLPLDVDEDGKELFKEDIIKEVLDDLEKRRGERGFLEQ